MTALHCTACHAIGQMHCAHPDECGNMVASAAPPQADRPTLDQILYAITSLQGAAITLTEYARELADNPDATLSTIEEAPQAIADALATTLDAMRQDYTSDDETQLRGALARYLAGRV